MTVAMPVPQALADRLAAFLADLDRPEAGREVYDAYAADAPLYGEMKLRRRQDVAREDFRFLHAAGHRLYQRDHGEAPRRPQVRDLAPVSLDAATDRPDRRVAWYAATERDTGKPLHLGVGWQEEDGDWKIGWLTLADAPQAWSFELGRVQTMADHYYGEGAMMIAPRSFLDVAWHRLHGRQTPPVLTLPEDRFGCQMTTRCCRNGFQVDVPGTSQAVLDAIPWAELGLPQHAGVKLAERPEGKLQLKGAGETCRFLDGQGHCELHKAAGRALFPVCAVFPFRFRETPDGLVVTTSYSCGSARAGLGPPLSERTDEIYARYAIGAQGQPPETFDLGPGHTVPWELFKAAEEVLLSLMDRRDLPLSRRLWLCERAMTDISAGRAPDLDAEVTRELGQPTPEEHAHWQAFLTTYAPHLGVDIIDPPTTWSLPLDHPQADMVTRLLRSMLYDKSYSYAEDLWTALHVCTFQYALFAFLAAGMPEGHVPDVVMWKLAGVFAHAPVYTALGHTPEQTEAMRRALADPGFGMRILLAGGVPT